jgi:WD40 repeat protein
MSIFRVWSIVLPAIILISSIFTPQPASAQYRSKGDLLRAVCKNTDLKNAYLDRVKASRGKQERTIVAFELDEECAVVGMPAEPRNATADADPNASHTAECHDARYSADGKTILSASKDGTLRLWNAQTGKSIRKIDVPGASPAAKDAWKFEIHGAGFVGDGSKIAVSNGGNPVHVLDTATGKLIADIPFPGGLGGAYWAPRVAATAKGLVLIAGQSADVFAYDTATNAVRYRLAGHDSREANAVAVSETASLVATGTKLNEHTAVVRLWKLETGERVGEFPYSTGRRTASAPSTMAFSRDGTRLAVAFGGTVVVYDLANKSIVQKVVTHPLYNTFSAAFTADGRGLLTCRLYPVLWDISSGKIVRRFGPFTDLCHSVDVSPDGKYAVTTSLGSDVRIWDISTGAFYRRLGRNTRSPH